MIITENTCFAYKNTGNVRDSIAKVDKEFMTQKASYKAAYRKRGDIMSEARGAYYKKLRQEVTTGAAHLAAKTAVKVVTAPVVLPAKAIKRGAEEAGRRVKKVANTVDKIFGSPVKKGVKFLRDPVGNTARTVQQNHEKIVDRVTGKNIRKAAQEFSKDPLKYGLERSAALRAGKGVYDTGKSAYKAGKNAYKRIERFAQNRNERIKLKKYWDEAKKDARKDRYEYY